MQYLCELKLYWINDKTRYTQLSFIFSNHCEILI